MHHEFAARLGLLEETIMPCLSQGIKPADVKPMCMCMQIRAQLAAEGFPLYGDTLYSSLALGASPQARQDLLSNALHNVSILQWSQMDKLCLCVAHAISYNLYVHAFRLA